MNQVTLSFPTTFLTIDQIATLAALRRKKLGFGPFDMSLNVDLVKAIENCDDFLIRVMPDGELERHYALARPDYCPPEIHIRDSVYEDACRCEPEAIFTLAHEMGHIDCDHKLQPPGRMIPHFYLEKECSGEWQADVFALLLLAPPTLVASVNCREGDGLSKWFGIPTSKINFYLQEFGELLHSRKE